MNSIFDFIKSLLGLDSSRRKSARYFSECENAYWESQKQQKQKEDTNAQIK